MNCAYSLPTWLTLDHLAKTAQCITLDLPELYLLDIPLVYQTGALTRELAMQHHAEFVSLRERLADERSRKTLEAIMRLRLDGNRAALLDVLCRESRNISCTGAPSIRSSCEATSITWISVPTMAIR